MEPEEKSRAAAVALRNIVATREPLRHFLERHKLGINFFSQSVKRGSVELKQLFRILDILEIPPRLFLALVDDDARAHLSGQDFAKVERIRQVVFRKETPWNPQ